MKKIITTILMISVFVWCIPKISNAEEIENVSLGPKETAVLLSVVFPGIGQIYNKQTTKGIVLAGIGAASLIASIVMYNTANKTYDDYEKKGDPNDSLYDTYLSQITATNIFLGIYAVVWGYSVVDAYLGASKNKVSLNILPYKKDGVMVVYTKTF